MPIYLGSLLFIFSAKVNVAISSQDISANIEKLKKRVERESEFMAHLTERQREILTMEGLTYHKKDESDEEANAKEAIHNIYHTLNDEISRARKLMAMTMIRTNINISFYRTLSTIVSDLQKLRKTDENNLLVAKFNEEVIDPLKKADDDLDNILNNYSEYKQDLTYTSNKIIKIIYPDKNKKDEAYYKSIVRNLKNIEGEVSQLKYFLSSIESALYFYNQSVKNLNQQLDYFVIIK